MAGGVCLGCSCGRAAASAASYLPGLGTGINDNERRGSQSAGTADAAHFCRCRVRSGSAKAELSKQSLASLWGTQCQDFYSRCIGAMHFYALNVEAGTPARGCGGREHPKLES